MKVVDLLPVLDHRYRVDLLRDGLVIGVAGGRVDVEASRRPHRGVWLQRRRSRTRVWVALRTLIRGVQVSFCVPRGDRQPVVGLGDDGGGGAVMPR
ncbi:hypothetical protein [Sporichthya polymorpha]|uniref:hypothetical protein n=1 Tax=Sporichthya polymorpha TaxID=35751 RepID=UPI0003788331|nr:hypothetical protein [Sporichthya polymorpha]